MRFSRTLRTVLAALAAAIIVPALTSDTSPTVTVSSPSASLSTCGTDCDGKPAALAAPHREADTASVDGRTVQLSINDTDQTAFATISSASPDDEVWIDRSWDGGRTWDQKTDDTRVARASTSATTAQSSLVRSGRTSVVRACGKAGDRPTVACTGWSPSRSVPTAGPDWDRGAVDALMNLYDRQSGLWRSTGWWNSANALTSLIDYMSATNDHRYLWAVANTYDRNRSAKGGEFRNGFLDDTGWWALAWIRAYDLTRDQRYLRTAQADVDHMWSYHDGVCGGGVWWSQAKNYKNAITNELFIKAAAQLHTRIPGDQKYLQDAQATWDWFSRSGMINGGHLVNDGLDTKSCKNNQGTTWSYNQGVILGGLVDLAQATGNQDYVRQAERLADASTKARGLHAGGDLVEPCEADDCGPDGPSFKGIYVRNLGELSRATSSATYHDYLRRHADSAYRHDRTPYDQYGEHWAGPPGPITGATQQSAVDLMVAALH